MKMNQFVVNGMDSVDESPGREPLGHRAIRLIDPEEELVKSIDEGKMSLQKRLATRFLTFLGNRRLTIESLKLLPIEEQAKLKREFFLDED